ncbi:SanA/YdcF family protein [Ruminococcus gauvreauii]|uniref:YdcF family protein n=1 Tax=Ruminococcus gauvreauii TaxID=438033 RepID=A0ABY5VK93_9FIRM|nr:ElyC/SanA/YdcF family protein [Ruminococcus gauvreauii]UWP60727.1 YdcF family protein [Ruminococcus gauvreauii]
MIPVIPAVLILLLTIAVSLYITATSKNFILTEDLAAKKTGADGILILGAAVWEGQKPSHMLHDRLLTGISLYRRGAAPKIIVSGDHGRPDYDEVNVMKDFAMRCGVPSEDIFMDHAGFNTYDSMYRAREVFQAERLIVVTQRYHLYRSLYTARRLGLAAYGVCADRRPYTKRLHRNIRELLSRDKAVVMTFLKPKPKYLGPVIPITGNGDLTNDR